MSFLGLDWNWDKSYIKKAVGGIINGWQHNNSGTISPIARTIGENWTDNAAGVDYSGRNNLIGMARQGQAEPRDWNNNGPWVNDPYGPMGPQGPSDQSTEWIDPFADTSNPSGGSGYSAAAALQAMLQQIDESTARQRGVLDQNKATSLGNINSAMDRYRQQIGTNYADYQGQAAATQQAIAQRIAEQQAAAAQRASALQNSVASIGGTNGAAIQSQAQNLADALKASGGYQQDLSSRLAQVAANSQRQYENSGDLVRQGATGTLENNYNAMLNALLANMEQAKMQAQQSAYSGGGGGGSSSSASSTDYTKLSKQAADRQTATWAANGVMPDASQLIQNLLLRGDIPSLLTYLTSQQAANTTSGN